MEVIKEPAPFTTPGSLSPRLFLFVSLSSLPFTGDRSMEQPAGSPRLPLVSMEQYSPRVEQLQ